MRSFHLLLIGLVCAPALAAPSAEMSERLSSIYTSSGLTASMPSGLTLR